MDVRDSIKPLLARLRREIGDGEELLKDGDIADVLEQFGTIVRYHPLRAHTTRTPNGLVQYLDFESGIEWWETDAQVVNGSWASVSPTRFDWVRGRVHFTTHQSSALYISGTYYDYWRATEALLTQLIATLRRTAVDRRDRDAELKRNQQIETLNELRRTALANQTVHTAPGVRRDT